MSKSYKKTPIFGIAGSSEKEDKRFANRAFRRISRVLLNKEEYEKIPIRMRETIDVWCMSKDGKSYWSNAPDRFYRK